MKRIFHAIVIGSLAVGAWSPALAQTPNPNDAGFGQAEAAPVDDSGDPLYGYIATAFLCVFCIFAVTKSSRRS